MFITAPNKQVHVLFFLIKPLGFWKRTSQHILHQIIIFRESNDLYTSWITAVLHNSWKVANILCRSGSRWQQSKQRHYGRYFKAFMQEYHSTLNTTCHLKGAISLYESNRNARVTVGIVFFCKPYICLKFNVSRHLKWTSVSKWPQWCAATVSICMKCVNINIICGSLVPTFPIMQLTLKASFLRLFLPDKHLLFKIHSLHFKLSVIFCRLRALASLICSDSTKFLPSSVAVS